MKFTRRTFLKHTPSIVLGPAVVEGSAGCGESPALGDSDTSLFQHGIASGDPLSDAVILWTRITIPSPAKASITVAWQIATQADMREVVAEGSSTTGSNQDYTVKVDARGLRESTFYFYQFEANGSSSPIGRTRTAPSGQVAQLRIAAVSCANYPAGYFHAYRRIAERTDLDFVLHLGDYLYEYEDGYFGYGEPLDRVPKPNRELVTLSDYRERHAQYKTDLDLQQAHSKLPFVAVWDDHEIANDSYKDGAQNHQSASDGSYQRRKSAAMQAYFEWMPIRRLGSDAEPQVYRTFEYGDLVRLITLDTRLTGRDRQVTDPCDISSIEDSSRSLLGETQEQWLLSQLRLFNDSTIQWCVLGQQVMMGQLSDVAKECVADPDQWDGYAESRKRVLSELRNGAIDNVVVLTVDAHSSWAIDLTENPFDSQSYDSETGNGSLAVEFIVPGITSAGSGGDPLGIVADNPHVKFNEGTSQGYLIVDITPARAKAEWYFVDNVTASDGSTERLAATYSVRSGANRLETDDLS